MITCERIGACVLNKKSVALPYRQEVKKYQDVCKIEISNTERKKNVGTRSEQSTTKCHYI